MFYALRPSPKTATKDWGRGIKLHSKLTWNPGRGIKLQLIESSETQERDTLRLGLTWEPGRQVTLSSGLTLSASVTSRLAQTVVPMADVCQQQNIHDREREREREFFYLEPYKTKYDKHVPLVKKNSHVIYILQKSNNDKFMENYEGSC